MLQGINRAFWRNAEESPRALVTGGAGFIGTHLIRDLLNSHPRMHVVSLDCYSSGYKSNHIDDERVLYLEGHTAVDPMLFPITFPHVYHLGEYSRITGSFKDIIEVQRSNQTGTFNVVEYCVKTKAKLIYAASSSKFGATGDEENLSPYSWTKSKNCELIKNYAKWFGLTYAITYFFSVYGPGHISVGDYATVIAIFEKQYLEGGPITVVLPGTQRRDFCVTGDTKILMADGSCKEIKDIQVGELVLSFDEHPINHKRKLKFKKVEATSSYVSNNVYLIETESGSVRATGNHPWLTRKGSYSNTESVKKTLETKGTALVRGFGHMPKSIQNQEQYRLGYIVGSIHGDGYSTRRTDKNGAKTFRYGLEVTDAEFAMRFLEYSKYAGIETVLSTRQPKYLNSKLVYIVCSCKESSVNAYEQIESNANLLDMDFQAGYLAAIYDGEGDLQTKAIRISNKNPYVIQRVRNFLDARGFVHGGHTKKNGVVVIEVQGGMQELLRFCAEIQPAITRKKYVAENREAKGKIVKVNSITKVEPERVYNLQIEDTQTYIANGLMCHNTHVYDIVNGIRLAAQNGHGDGYLLGTNEQYSIQEVAEMFGLPIEYLPERPGERFQAVEQISRARSELGWQPVYRLPTYIEEFKAAQDQLLPGTHG